LPIIPHWWGNTLLDHETPTNSESRLTDSHCLLKVNYAHKRSSDLWLHLFKQKKGRFISSLGSNFIQLANLHPIIHLQNIHKWLIPIFKNQQILITYFKTILKCEHSPSKKGLFFPGIIGIECCGRERDVGNHIYHKSFWGLTAIRIPFKKNILREKEPGNFSLQSNRVKL
jgi:hypothetical protein